MAWHGAGNPEDQLFERYGVRAFELQQDAGTFVGGDHRYSAGSCYLPYQQYNHDGSCIQTGGKPDHAPDRCDEFHDPCAVRCTGCDDRSGWRADSAGDHVFSVPPGGCIYDGTV